MRTALVRALRILAHPVTVIAVALVTAFIVAWSWPKSVEEPEMGVVAWYRGFFWAKEGFFAPHYYLLEAPDCTVEFNELGYNPFESRYPDGKLQAEGLCLVESSVRSIPVPFIDDVTDGRFYKPDGSFGSEVRNGAGVLTLWYPNGRKRWEVEFDDFKRKRLRGWYENGQLQVEEHYRDGKWHGLIVGYHPNGQKRSDAEYDRGRVVGPSITEYNEDGTIETVSQFSDGRRTRTEHFNHGKIWRIEYYDQGTLTRIEDLDMAADPASVSSGSPRSKADK